MAAAEKISALRGMRDVFSAEYTRRRALQDALAAQLRLHGYAPIDLPLLENTELYLRKAGEAAAARLYDFHFKSRRIALRPEMTASILRAYVEQLQDEPLPLRLQYSGPVFRYEKPQQHRYRQFTLSGAELLGASGPEADAEILYLACSSLQRLGLRDYRLVIGHSAVLEDFLRKLGLRKQLHNFLLRNMENLRKRGLPFLLDSLRTIFPEFELAAHPSQAAAASGQKSQPLINALREMTDSEAQQAISDFLRSLNIRIDTNRDEAEVIDRLLHKIREAEQGPKLQIALEYMQRLCALTGAPAAVLDAARTLATDFEFETDAFAALESTLAALDDFGELSGEIWLDFSLNRGLHYYTGLMFEVYHSVGAGGALQLCGGGRYDTLISSFGGSEPTPAVGFACGLERIASALPSPAAPASSAVCIIPVATADFAASQQIARTLRGHGFAVEVNSAERSLRRRLKYADRRGAALVIIIGESERQAQQAILRDMRSHQEEHVALAALPSQVEALLKGRER